MMNKPASQAHPVDQLSGLYAISQILSASLDLDQVLQALVTEAAHLLGAVACTLSFLEEGKLRIAVTSPKEVVNAQVTYELAAFPTTEKSLRERTPFYLEVGADHAYDEQALLQELGFEALILAPIVFGETPLGIIEAYSDVYGRFNNEMALFLHAIANQAAGAIHNLIRFQETERRAEELDLLYHASQSISQVMSQEASVREVARQVTQVLKVNGCTISRYDAEQDWLITLLDFSQDMTEAGLVAAGAIYHLEDYPITRQVIETRRSIVLHRDDPDMDPAELALLTESGDCTLLMLPLVARGHVIGLLEIYHNEGRHRFSQTELWMAERLSVDIAISLENARLLEQTQDQAQQMAVLSAIQHSLMTAIEPSVILSDIVYQIKFFLKVNSCSVFLHNEMTGQLDLAVSTDPSLADRSVSIPLDKGIAGRCMRTRRAILVNDTEKEAEYQGVLPGSQLEIRALMCAPLLFQDKVLGVIQALSSKIDSFTESHLNLLASAAAAAAVALDNARLHAGLIRRVAELDALLKSGLAVAGTSELNEILKAIVIGGSRIPGVDYANIILYDLEEERFVSSIHNRDGEVATWIPYSRTRSRGVSRWILEERQTLLVNDTERDDRVNEAVHQKGIKSFIGVPILAGQKPVGVLYVNARQPNVFDEGHVAVLRSLATQAGVAVERTRLLDDIRNNEKQLQAILNSTADVIIMTNGEGLVTLFNPAAKQAFEQLSEEAHGCLAAELFAGTPLATALSTFEGERAENPTIFEMQLANGRTLLASLSFVLDESEQRLGNVVVMHDITHLKELDRMKNEFVATVSHDLKNPITAIQGFTQLLPRMGDLNEAQHRAVLRIHEVSDRMLKLVVDLLDLGKIEAGMALNKASCDLAVITRDAIFQLESQAMAKDIQLEMATEAAAPLFGDPQRLQQVVHNLINNAIKYTPKHGRIHVSVRANGESVKLAVQDTGCGIAAADLPHIFDKFYRVYSPETEGIEGTGIGLSIVKAIVDQHEGSIQVESERNQGTTFLVQIPLS